MICGRMESRVRQISGWSNAEHARQWQTTLASTFPGARISACRSLATPACGEFEPDQVNDAVMADFIAQVRARSLAACWVCSASGPHQHSGQR